MAKHIVTLASSGIPAVSKDEFYHQLRSGDMVACCGDNPIAKTIERCSGSLLSHILAVHLPFADAAWATIEATAAKGVHVGLLADYTDCQDGPVILLRRPALTPVQIDKFLVSLYSLVDDTYDWQQEVTTVFHRMFGFLPVVQPAKELYCSGLMYAGAKAVAPFAYVVDAAHPNYPTPEDIYVDPSVEAVCYLAR